MKHILNFFSGEQIDTDRVCEHIVMQAFPQEKNFHYTTDTELLFQKLEILFFKKLVIHRIAMLMFKSSKQIVLIAIHMLFARNAQYHNYNTRQSRSLHPSVGRGEAIYMPFSFHGVNILNYLSRHIRVNVTYIYFNKLTKSYLLNNNIIYRLV